MPVEEVAASLTFRQDLIDSGIVICTEDLWKTYTWALKKCTRFGEPMSRFIRGSTRPSWGRQAPGNPR